MFIMLRKKSFAIVEMYMCLTYDKCLKFSLGYLYLVSLCVLLLYRIKAEIG